MVIQFPFNHGKNLNSQNKQSIKKYKISFPYQCNPFNEKYSNFQKNKKIYSFIFYSHLWSFKICPWVKKGVYQHAINKYKYSDQMYMQPQIKNMVYTYVTDKLG